MSEVQRVIATLHAIGERPVGAPQRISGGWGGTGIWRFESATRGPALLRVFAPDETGVAARETAVMVHARALGLPVPEVYAARKIGEAPVMVLEWYPGGSLDRVMRRRPWQSAVLGSEAGWLMARLHGAPAPSGLALARDWPHPTAFPPALRERLRADDVRADALVHLDFHPLNLVLGSDGELALIDWTNARAGDPRFDLARSLVLFALLPGLSPLQRALARLLFGPIARAWRAAYLEAVEPPRDMPLFLAWAGYGMLREWHFNRQRAGLDPNVEGGWEPRLRTLVDGWMRKAGLDAG